VTPIKEVSAAVGENSPLHQESVVGVNAFYEKVIKVKADDVAAFLINCFSSA